MFFEILDALFGPSTPPKPETPAQYRARKQTERDQADYEQSRRRDEEARERQRWEDQQRRDSEATRKFNNRGYYDPV